MLTIYRKAYWMYIEKHVVHYPFISGHGDKNYMRRWFARASPLTDCAQINQSNLLLYTSQSHISKCYHFFFFRGKRHGYILYELNQRIKLSATNLENRDTIVNFRGLRWLCVGVHIRVYFCSWGLNRYRKYSKVRK